MTEVPHVWNIGEAIPLEIFVQDPANPGNGLTSQTAFITLTIKRESDGQYWDGAAWQVSVSTIAAAQGLAEIDATNEPGRYLYLLPAAANSQGDRYTVRGNINNPGIPLTGDNYEVHVSRVTDLRVYESVADG